MEIETKEITELLNDPYASSSLSPSLEYVAMRISSPPSSSARGLSGSQRNTLRAKATKRSPSSPSKRCSRTSKDCSGIGVDAIQFLARFYFQLESPNQLGWQSTGPAVIYPHRPNTCGITSPLYFSSPIQNRYFDGSEYIPVWMTPAWCSKSRAKRTSCKLC
ncbi:hypothetical protein SODALDRAFT_327953 [Sodiomyces alkalinus F11]|uniref:Uncharacterized protein n=1 Tax=Sodiomyces alkalinus (strain CBS 110278 / VKM F-3762 / F11) TaxID=1314773 RepID=A0A3N2QAG6_SODAK|nr:hypothetical protein SODALDRAFT_327953 [Sodiomyces alkalinus F11]ROT43740.1 hypothetical protein SODALDRAFT_327953 [Sodiomyces alkalinus F11]